MNSLAIQIEPSESATAAPVIAPAGHAFPAEELVPGEPILGS